MAPVLELDWDKEILLFGIKKFIYFTGLTAKISWVGKEIIDELMDSGQVTFTTKTRELLNAS